MLTSIVGSAFSDEVATEFLGAIAGRLAPTGLSLTLLSSDETAGRIPARDVPMDGALVYHCDPRSPALGWLRAAQAARWSSSTRTRCRACRR